MKQQNEPLYILCGRVVHGKANGRKAGMPTANLEITEGTVLPPQGVYAAEVYTCGVRYAGVTNVGLRPSVDDEQRVTVETFIIDFSGDLYDQEITLHLMHYLRPTVKMNSLAEVQIQVQKDAQLALDLLRE